MITPEEVCQAVEDAGLTGEQLRDLLKRSKLLIDRNKIAAAIKKVEVEREEAGRVSEEQRQQLQASLVALEAEIAVALGPGA